MALRLAFLLCCLYLQVCLSSASRTQCNSPLTVQTFIQTVEEIEDAIPKHWLPEKTVRVLQGLVENSLKTSIEVDGESVQHLQQMLRHGISVGKNGTVEYGVLFDGEETIAIVDALAQIGDLTSRLKSLSDYLAFAIMKTKVVRSVKDKVGPKGVWIPDPGCPNTYSITSRPSAVTRAQMLGSLDGLILKSLLTSEDAQLSTALRRYYFGSKPASKNRADFICQEDTRSILRRSVVDSCEEMKKATSLGTNNLPVRFAIIKNCQEIAEAALGELYGLVDTSDTCDLGPSSGKKARRNGFDATSFNENSFARVKITGCKLLANNGDCNFYQCVENEHRNCGDKGFSLGFALPYCNRFDTLLHEFSARGQNWIRASRTCLMTGILPHYKTVHLHHRCQTGACSSLMETFLQLMPECYLDTEPGLCEILQDASNWRAFMKVLEVDEFGANHFLFTYQQVEDAMQSCLCHDKNAWLAIKHHMTDTPDYLLNFKQARNVQAKSEVKNECQTYARNGDCRFYECMEERFPCKQKFYSSHFADFELPSCAEFVRNTDLFAADGKVWLKSSQSCLMQALLPLYNNNSINCAEMHSWMFDRRIDCFLNSEFCGIMRNNDWAFDQSTLTNGFPTYIPNLTSLATYGDDDLDLAFYYRSLLAFQRLLKDINCECFNRGLSATKYWFSTVYSTECDCLLKIKN